jgi:hypothetical protein
MPAQEELEGVAGPPNERFELPRAALVQDGPVGAGGLQVVQRAVGGHLPGLRIVATDRSR